MKITLIAFENNAVTLFVEREKGKYNNFEQTVKFNQSEIEGLTKDQIITKAWAVIKPTALLTFDRVWECKIDEDSESWAISPFNETENTVGFKIVEIPPPPPPQPSEVEVLQGTVTQLQNIIDVLMTDIIPNLNGGI